MKSPKMRTLTATEEQQILDWCHANPKSDIDSKIIEWRREFNCSEFSIIKTLVREQLQRRSA